MNSKLKKDVVRCLILLQDRMPQEIILFGFPQKALDIAQKLDGMLNEMEVIKNE